MLRFSKKIESPEVSDAVRRFGVPFLFGVCACIAPLKALDADTVRLKNGNSIRNVVVQKMSADNVVYRTRAGRLKSVRNSLIRDVLYAPLKVPERERRATRLPRIKVRPAAKPSASTRPTVGQSLSGIEKKWNDLEIRSRIAESRLQQVLQAVRATSVELKSGDESKEFVARGHMNQLLREKKKYEHERRELREKQKTLTREFLATARRMGVVDKPPFILDDTKPYSFLLRSAILPGWGQFGRGRNISALIFGVGSLALVASLNDISNQYNKVVLRRNDALRGAVGGVLLGNDGLRNLAIGRGVSFEQNISRLSRANEIRLGTLLIFYVLNLVDASIGHEYDFGFVGETGRPNFLISFTQRF